MFECEIVWPYASVFEYKYNLPTRFSRCVCACVRAWVCKAAWYLIPLFLYFLVAIARVFIDFAAFGVDVHVWSTHYLYDRMRLYWAWFCQCTNHEYVRGAWAERQQLYDVCWESLCWSNRDIPNLGLVSNSRRKSSFCERTFAISSAFKYQTLSPMLLLANILASARLGSLSAQCVLTFKSCNYAIKQNEDHWIIWPFEMNTVALQWLHIDS